MKRYLSFSLSEDEAEQSLFSDYTLSQSALLPFHFGNVAPINIFLGENNSGKSRFMREIIKSNVKIMDFIYSADEIKIMIDNILNIIKSTDLDSLYELNIALDLDRADEGEIQLLTVPGKQGRANNRIDYKPKSEIITLQEGLVDLQLYTSSTKTLLDFLTQSDNRNNIIQNIIPVLIQLEKISVIYKALVPSGVLGSRYRAVYNTNTIRFSNYQSTVELTPGYSNAHLFNEEKFRNYFFKDKSKEVDSIRLQADEIIKSLRKLLMQQSRALIKNYIPTLRTARTLTDNRSRKVAPEEDVMRYTIVADYKLDDSRIHVTTGLALYPAINAKRNANRAGREEFKKFELFLSETFFDGKEVEVVAQHESNDILVSVAKEERTLPNLGDGIQAIILLLYPLFTAQSDSWIFIEEPETHMHPGFQRLFIKTISTHPVILAKKLIIFLTTHSNHILDFAQDEAENINLFTFRKVMGDSREAKYQVQLTAPHDLECLTALGVQNSSVFLSNCTIWVEGITDRIYLKAYLKAFLAHKKHTYSLLEGLHYSFLEYAGANVSHYAFGVGPQRVTVTDEALRDIQALSISNRIMLIADQDAGKKTKHDRLTSQQHAGFEYVVLPTREIENLLTPEVIVAALKKLYSKQADHFDAGQLKQGQYKTAYLAKYLQTKFAELPDSFIAKSGTVDSAKKRQFAEAAAEAITSWDMLSDDAKKLTEQVFEFIMGHNPRLGSN